jgi:ATP-dependent Clp protease ATP-binding subunit ClpB
MIRPDKFTIKSQEAIAQAEDIAGKRGNPEIVPAHILAALLAQTDGVVVPILKKLGAAPEALAGETQKLIDGLSRVEGSGASGAHVSAELKRVLEKAFTVADSLKDDYVSTEHLLVAMADEKGSQVSRMLSAHGVTKESVLSALKDIRGNQRVTDPDPEGKFQALEKYAKDLTELARRGKLDPVGMRKSDGSSRCSPGGRRITPCSSASLVWARPLSWRDWPSASFRATYPRASKIKGSWHWISVR